MCWNKTGRVVSLVRSGDVSTRAFGGHASPWWTILNIHQATASTEIAMYDKISTVNSMRDLINLFTPVLQIHGG